MENSLINYWCHSCKCNLFQPQSLGNCFVCGSDLIEEVERGSPHPSTFQPQDLPSARVYLTQTTVIPVTFVRFLMRNPPENESATEEQIRSLEDIQNSKNDCAICQESVGDKGKKMKCKHEFHENCIVPWLRIKNSCPVCRTNI